MAYENVSPRVTKPKRKLWDWQAAILMVALLMTVSVRLEMTRWAKQLGYVESIALAGAILGLMLAMSRFTPRIHAWLFVGYTTFYLPLAMGNMIEGEAGGLARLLSLWGRLQGSMQQFAANRPVEDPILFVCAMALLFWFTTAVCCYWLVNRQDAFKVLFLPTIIILAFQFFDSQSANRIWNLAVYFFLCMGLIGRINLMHAHEKWAEEGVIAGTQPEADLNRYMLIFSVMLVFLVWMVPYPQEFRVLYQQGVRKAAESTNFLEQRFQDLFAALKPSVVFGDAEPFPAAFTLGTTAPSGDKVVMQVSLLNGVSPVYWPAKVYDRFTTSQRWMEQIGTGQDFFPDATRANPPGLLANELKVMVNWQGGASTTLVMPRYATWVSRSAKKVNDRQLGDSYPLSWQSKTRLLAGDTYSAKFAPQAITQKLLRDASDEYQDWMTVQLESQRASIPEDITALAAKITEGQPTNFDKALAITTYLRQNYEYSEQLPELSSDISQVEWFLFDGRKGFCNQFATAEVMLLRASGIPARLVLGFTGGEADGKGGLELRQKNAHAWPEVFFEGVGWVIFEPTPPIDAVVYPSGESQPAISPPIGPFGEFADREQNAGMDGDASQVGASAEVARLKIPWGAVGWAVFAFSMITVLVILRQRITLTLAVIPALTIERLERSGIAVPGWIYAFLGWLAAGKQARAFSVINLSLWMLGASPTVSETPRQRGNNLARRLPEVDGVIRTVVECHELALFSSNPTQVAPFLAPARILLEAMRALWRHWLYGV